MDMRNSDDTSWIENLFVDYHMPLRKYGLTWFFDETKKLQWKMLLSP